MTTKVSDLYVLHPFPWEHIEDAVFTLHRSEDGPDRVTVDRWPDLMAVTHGLIEDAREEYLLASRDWSVLTIHPDNGVAFYQRVEDYPERGMGMGLYRLLWGELE